MTDILKCKMCGGDLRIIPGINIAECEYCGTKQSVPRTPDERKTSYFNRANGARRSNEFDKAIGIYESIVAEYPDEAEAYWGLCLCTYGIEYVDDPETGEKIPTCHRTVFGSIFDDKNFISAISYADQDQNRVYQKEAAEIERIQKKILNTIKIESPYDIFICYKESDERTGQRTKESVIGQTIYEDLCLRGFKTFFARVSLEEVLGQEYEPHIFAALNSARIMLVLGSSRENFYAPWVRNEWNRYLEFMNRDRNRTLIPCFVDMDAYNLPDEFTSLQAQDLGKVGAVQDIIRGIEKILGKNQTDQSITKTSAVSSTPDVLLERGKIAVRNKEWSKAKEFFEELLNVNPKDSGVYTYLLLVEKKCQSLEELSKTSEPIKNSNYFINAVEFADEDLGNALRNLSDIIDQRHSAIIKKKKRLLLCIVVTIVLLLSVGIGVGYYINNVLPYEKTYKRASSYMSNGQYDEAIKLYEQINYKDSESKVSECRYYKATNLMNCEEYDEAAELFSKIDYKDSKSKAAECNKKKAAESNERNRMEAEKLISMHQYYNAALVLEQNSDPESVKELLLETKYNTLVRFSKNELVEEFDYQTIDRFADELKNANYPNIENIYERIYTWTVGVEGNNYTIIRGPKEGKINIHFTYTDQYSNETFEGDIMGVTRGSKGKIREDWIPYMQKITCVNIDTNEPILCINIV